MPAVVALLMVVALCLELEGEAPASVPARRCDHGILVDGLLRCEVSEPVQVSQLCAGQPVPSGQTLVPGDALATSPGCQVSRMPPEMLAALQVPIDPNRASMADLTSLPRIGPAIAQRMVEARPFSGADDLLRVRGIGPKTLARLRHRVTFGPLGVSAAEGAEGELKP